MFVDCVTMLGVCLQVFSSIESDMSLWTHVDYSIVIGATAAFALELETRSFVQVLWILAV